MRVGGGGGGNELPFTPPLKTWRSLPFLCQTQPIISSFNSHFQEKGEKSARERGVIDRKGGERVQREGGERGE